MKRNILAYYAWEEDLWLDEFLDRFREVNAMVPTPKSLQSLQDEIKDDHEQSLIIVVNVGEGKQETEQFLKALVQTPLYSAIPLFFVGLNSEEEKQEWIKRYPNAKGIVVVEHTWDYDYEPIMRQIEAEWKQ
ncbi:hypothetical protein ACQCN2_20645 [Brevibacillus ginsengisoli]|uniref:hypothetical protein n=1 Tax=Brevibacillus ginsengisoli TaxID=363854 RepID=UPI003CEEF8B9